MLMSSLNNWKPTGRLVSAQAKIFSQSIDTAALEPDNANGWYDAKTQSSPSCYSDTVP